MEVNLLEECKVEPHDLAAQLVPQISTSVRFDVLLVADAPVDVLEPDHRLEPTLLSGPEWLRDQETLSPAWTWRCWVRPMLCLGLVVGVV